MFTSNHNNLINQHSLLVNRKVCDPVSSGQFPESNALFDRNGPAIVSKAASEGIQFVCLCPPDPGHCSAKLVEDGLPHPWLRWSGHHPRWQCRQALGHTSQETSPGKSSRNDFNCDCPVWFSLKFEWRACRSFSLKFFSSMELPSEVFALALHPTVPLLAAGLLEGHVHW